MRRGDASSLLEEALKASASKNRCRSNGKKVKAAQTLGPTVPTSILIRDDDVVE